MAMRPALVALAALVLAGPGAATAAAQAPARDSDLEIEFAQVPRLALEMPVTVRTSGPASYRATATLHVGDRRIGEFAARGRSGVRGTLVDLRIPKTMRARALKESRGRRGGPRARVRVTATLDGRPGSASQTIEAALRLPPFYDGKLRFPDLPRSVARRYAISWDLPFEFTQIYGAMAGTPSVGSFRKYVRSSPDARPCSLSFSGWGTTANRPGTLPGPARERGRRGPWRFVRGDTGAVLSRRAPARLPGKRAWLVVRFGVDALGESCASELQRTVRASLVHAIRTVVVRYRAPQLGPGFETA